MRPYSHELEYQLPMTTNLSEDYSENHTGAQLSTFRNIKNVSIHGGSFSMTSTTTEQRTHADSGKLQMHYFWLLDANMPKGHRDRRRPYSRNIFRIHTGQNGYDPETSLNSGAK